MRKSAIILIMVCGLIKSVKPYTYDVAQRVIIHNFGLHFSRVGIKSAYFTSNTISGIKAYDDSFLAIYPFWSRESFDKNSYYLYDFSGIIWATVGLMNTIADGPQLVAGSRLKNFNSNFPNSKKTDNPGGLDMDLMNLRFAWGPQIGNSNFVKFGFQGYMGIHSANINNENYAKLNDSGTLAYGGGIHYVRDMIDAVGRLSIMYNWMRHHSIKELDGKQVAFEASYYFMEKFSATAFYNVVNINHLIDEVGKTTKPSLKSTSLGLRLAYTFIPE